MTDKEWNELREWAKALDSNNIWVKKDHIAIQMMDFNRDGYLYGGEYCLTCEELTLSQIKAIIENLL